MNTRPSPHLAPTGTSSRTALERSVTPEGQLSATRAPQERYVHKSALGSSHWWALRNTAPQALDARVLDIGPGAGTMGKMLREAGASHLTAVEIDPRAREHARTIYDRVEETIEPLRDERYSIVLLLDVLEHIADADAFLHQVLTLVRPGGRVVISVPNITHWSIRLLMLLGRFPMMDRGILDRTHLTYFDRSRFQAMIRRDSDFSVIACGASISPMELALPALLSSNALFRAFAWVRYQVAQKLPALTGYQHLAVLLRDR